LPGSVDRIELYSGPSHTTRYVVSGDVSASERAAAREMEQAENEEIYVASLERLKQQYVSGERVMEAHRRGVQRDLYGKSITSGWDSSYSGGLSGGYGWGGDYLGGYGGYGGSGYPGGFSSGYSNDSYQSETRSLKDGVGDEGRMKAAFAPVIAQQATPEYAAAAQSRYEKALARAAGSPTLARVLSLPRAEEAAYEPSFTKDSRVVIWVGTDKYAGVVKADRPGWVVLDTDDGEVRLRKSEIDRSVVRAGPGREAGREAVSDRAGSAGVRGPDAAAGQR
jgi:hypothetical protein